MAENIFWVPKEARWETIRAHTTNPDIGEVIDSPGDSLEVNLCTVKLVPAGSAAMESLEKVDGSSAVTTE